MIIVRIVLIALVVLFALGYGAFRLYLKHMWAEHAENTKNLQVKLEKGVNDLEYTYGQDLYTEVSEYHQKITNGAASEYVFYYPKEIHGRLPVVLWGNGTGNTYSNYEPALKSLASYGFIVVGCDDQNTGSGETLHDMAIYVKSTAQDEHHMLYGKIDTNHLGIGGHSQGACGAINALTRYEDIEYQSLFTTSLPKLSMCRDKLTMKFAYWKYDPSAIDVPYFATSGTESFDSKWVAPLSSMVENAEALPDHVFHVRARQVGANHNIVNEYHACGYFNAWFCYTLKDDQKAGKIFAQDGELMTNPRWVDACRS